MMNKRGYVLVYAIGVVALLILLAATLTNVTLSRSTWAINQSQTIKEMNYAEAQVDAASSELADYFKNTFSNNNYRYLSELISEDNPIDVQLDIISSKYNVRIRDLTKESCKLKDKFVSPCYPVRSDTYTYGFEIVYPNKLVYESGDIVATKKFFLSMIPSFLYFALGSKYDMSINGGPYIYGDMFIDQDLYISNTANYIIKDELKSQPSTFLTVNNDQTIYAQNKLKSCNVNYNSCFNFQYDPRREFQRIEKNFIDINDEWLYPTTFTSVPPKIKKYDNQFLDVDFDSSYKYYLNEAIRLPDDTEIYKDISLTPEELTSQLQTFIVEGRLHEVTSFSEINNTLSDKSIYIKTTNEFGETIELNQGLTFTKDKWIIVDGDLNIGIRTLRNNLVDANILVTGNIMISGNVIINSTIYALGNATIHNAYINNIASDNNQLMLLSKGDLQISKINQFQNYFDSMYTDFNTGEIKVNPDIKGFLYTDNNAKIYTVNSYIALEGGIFTNVSLYREYLNSISDSDPLNDLDLPAPTVDMDVYGLVVNSYRGAVTYNLDGTLSFREPLNYFESRFVVKHSNSIILNQPKGLPMNKKINYLSENATVIEY